MRLNPFIVLCFSIMLFVSCQKQVESVKFEFNNSGELITKKTLNASVVSIGKVTGTTLDKLKEPGYKVTRIGIRTSNKPRTAYDIYDINFDGEVKIIGDGKYDFSKLPSSNTWYITLEKKGINDIIIKEGQKEVDHINTQRGVSFLILGIFLAILGFATSITGIGLLIGIIGIIIAISGWGIIPQ